MELIGVIEFGARGTSMAPTSRKVNVPGATDLNEIHAFITTEAPQIDGLMKVSKDFDDALYFFSRVGYPWIDLYKAFEIASAANGGDAQLSILGWCSSRELKRFKHTANHPGGVGEAARHARMGTDPPMKPMTVEEGRDFVWNLLRSWSAAQLSQSNA
jgi:hypothetical protein